MKYKRRQISKRGKTVIKENLSQKSRLGEDTHFGVLITELLHNTSIATCLRNFYTSRNRSSVNLRITCSTFFFSLVREFLGE